MFLIEYGSLNWMEIFYITQNLKISACFAWYIKLSSDWKFCLYFSMRKCSVCVFV
jgi:hypothetical protein